MKKQIIGSLILISLVVLAGCTASNGPPAQGVSTTYSAMTKSEFDFRMSMQKLWEDHIAWTRMFIVDASYDLGSIDATTQRLLKNQEDIGNAIKPYYGNDAGNKLTALLKDHILIAADIVKAAKAGDNNAVSEGQKRWTKNADDIAAFLSSANPNWKKDDLKQMLQMHLDATTEEVVATLQKDYAKSISAYDKVHTHALGMSDALSDGIVKQFPEKFQ